MPTNNCSFHLSSKKHLFATDGAHQRKPHQHKMLRRTACGVPSPIVIYNTIPMQSSGDMAEEGWRDCKSCKNVSSSYDREATLQNLNDTLLQQ